MGKKYLLNEEGDSKSKVKNNTCMPNIAITHTDHEQLSQSTFLQIYGCKSIQILCIKFRYREKNEHGYDYEVVVDSVPFKNCGNINLEKIDFEKFSQIAADAGSELISELSVFLGEKRVTKMKAYFAVDPEKMDKLFLNHFSDVYISLP